MRVLAVNVALQDAWLKARVQFDGVTGAVFGGIGNPPLDEPSGPVINVVVKTVLIAILAGLAWGVFTIANWLNGG